MVSLTNEGLAADAEGDTIPEVLGGQVFDFWVAPLVVVWEVYQVLKAVPAVTVSRHLVARICNGLL
jgi:hypothetical protein